MEPPLTLTRSMDTPRSLAVFMGTVANASLISHRSMSPGVMPSLLRAFLQAGVGPVSMMVGSEPHSAVISTRARGFRPALMPASLLPSRTSAAPSTMPEELPAWWAWMTFSMVVYLSSAVASKPMVPIISNEGISLASDSTEVPGRMVSSRPSISMPLMSLTGMTDLSKRPSDCARAARRCDSAA